VGVLALSYILPLFRFTFYENTVAFLYLSRLIFYLLYFAYFAHFIKYQITFRKTLMYGIIIFSTLTIAISFIQYFLYTDLRNLLYLGWDPHLSRMFGAFFDTSVAAAIYGLMFLFFIGSYRIFVPFFLVSTVLTFSRSSYIMLIILLIWNFISQKKIMLLFTFFAIFLFLIWLAPKGFGEGTNLRRTFSIQSRLNDYKEAIEVWKRSPLLGIGYNRIRFIKLNGSFGHAASSFSSSYLIILASGGIIGLLLFAACIVRLMMFNKMVSLLIGFIGFLSLTDNIILHPFVMFLLGALVITLLIRPSERLLQ
ncbi:O-antigen ligase family protein, partial [Candidatus Roizmanbacteria bacterium]|nr:O-antigen ligase family protein [Candidatus Roizmanbacteria bacterium]